MSNRTSLRRAVRAVLIGCGLATTVALPVVAADEQIAEVVVTGSRIARPNLEGVTPVLAIGQDDFQALGMENFADVAATLPQFSPSFGASRTQSTFSGAQQSGLNQVNLRNLTALRTVVLLNGRRLPGGTSTSTAVDFNTIPTANIERIEVLTGAAAAVYGADAVAGVINVITNKNFSGIEFGAAYGVTEEGDNENPSAHLMMGGDFAEGGHAQVTIQYDKQGRVSCADRYLCAEDFFWNNPAAAPLRGPAAYSAIGLNAQFFIPGRPGAVTSRDGSFTDANGALIPFSTPIDGYNRNAARDIAIPTDRLMFMAEVDYDLSENVSVFAELNYGQSETDSQFEGHPFQSSQAGSLVGGGPGVAGLQPSIPMNNPFIPAAIFNTWRAANPTADAATTNMTWAQRFNFFGYRGASNDRESVRGMAGLRGDFESIGGFGSGWNWEVSHVYGRTQLDSRTEGFVGTDRIYSGLRVQQVPGQPAGTYQCADAAARALGCVPINPFAPYTQQMIDYLTLAAGQRGQSELEDTVAFISGGLFELPAGSLRGALGVERRSFEGYLDYDEVISTGLVTGNQILDTPTAKIDTDEVFLELVVPVLADKPFAHSLELEGAYRISTSEYLEQSEDYDTWKFGGSWAPIEGLKFRAMQARSVRVPTPLELGGGGQTFGVVNDPCSTDARRNANPTRAANCAADGVAAGYAAPINVEQSVAGFAVGNPQLVPETATTLTYGVVWTPSFVDNLSVTIDRFEIDIEDFVNTYGRQSIANACYDTVDRQFCNLVSRGANPFVPGANYVLNSVNDTVANLSVYDISGVDVEVNYRFDISQLFGSGRDLGGLALSLRGTFYDQADTVPRPGAATIELKGFAGGSTTDQGFLERQIIGDLNYGLGDFSMNWNIRYLGSTDMSPFVTGFPKIDSHIYHNVRFGYDIGDSIELFAGVTNLLDKDPPFFASGTSGTQALDTIPAFYDVFGRSFFAGTKVRF